MLLVNGASYAGIKIDGRFNDWANVPKIYSDKKGDVDTARSGMDFLTVSMKLEGKYLYILIKGISQTGGNFDNGESLPNISIRISFVSSYSPLNRIRIATGSEEPGVITVSQPSAKTVKYGNAGNPCWRFGKIGKWRNGVEVKIPVYTDKNGAMCVGAMNGPVIHKRAQEKKRRRLSEAFISNVNVKTHLFIDKAEFPVYNTSL